MSVRRLRDSFNNVVRSDYSDKIPRQVSLTKFTNTDSNDGDMYEKLDENEVSEERQYENKDKFKKGQSFDSGGSYGTNESEQETYATIRPDSGIGGENMPMRQRKQSQWANFLDTVDANEPIPPGVFQIQLQQLARDGESDSLLEMLNTVPEQKRRRILNSSNDDEGVTALHLAARHNHYEACKLLIEFGANPDAKTESKATPLHFAARYKPKRKINYNDVKDAYVNEQQAESKSVIFLLSESGAHINNFDIEKQTALHSACIKGNSVAVDQLLKCRGIKIEATDSQGMTALHMAATHGHVEIVTLLLEVGAFIHSCDNDLMTPIHFACSEGNRDIVRMLLTKGEKENEPGAVQNMLLRPDAGKNTCLHLSVTKGHKEMILELLARYGKDVAKFVNVRRAHNDTPLHIAASNGFYDICKILIDSSAKVNARNDNLQNPLLLAAQHNHFKVVELLLQNNSEMEIRDKDNLTPLLVAAKYGHLETISWLIENNADVTATDKHDKNLLLLAVEDNRTFAVEELLQYESVTRLLDETDKNANSVLHIASKKGFLPIIQILLNNGARIDPKNEDEATPVHMAAMNGQHVVLRELLNHDKSMINSLDENANTALHLASLDGHTKCVEVLLEHNAHVGLRNTRQWTALECACAKGWETTALVLLKSNSTVNPAKGSRTTPLHQAATNGHVRVVNLLLEWKADVGAKIADGRNCLDCAIDKGFTECVEAILLHKTWKNAMRNAYMDPLTDLITTPARKLVLKMPEMAQLAFSRCITNNGKPPDEQSFEVTLDYEFLDDMYTIIEWGNNEQATNENVSISSKEKGLIRTTDAHYEAFNDHGRLHKQAMTYVEDSGMLRHNHPLSIMVNRKREALLQHPVVTGLLQYKWKKYGGLVYYSSLAFLTLFVILLNIYLILVPPPYAIDFTKSLANGRFYNQFASENIVNYTAPKPCYRILESGTDYRGYQSNTSEGIPCLNWDDTSTNSQLFPDAGLDSNYCRNPGTQFEKPWCFVDIIEDDGDIERHRELCDVPSCPIYVVGRLVPLGTTCQFPFVFGGTEFNACIVDGSEPWCSYTYDYDTDQNSGTCSEEDTRCNVDEDHRKPCGPAGVDQINCEARDCCFVRYNEGQPNEWSQCFQKLDICSDRLGYCSLLRDRGYCELNPEPMAVQCGLTCGFCNVTENQGLDAEYEAFLYLMTVYPAGTFDAGWQRGCYFVKPEVESFRGEGCHYKQNWEDVIRLILMALCCLNLFLLIVQIYNYQLEAFQPIFFLEIALYILCLLLVLNFQNFDLTYSTQMTTEEELYTPLVKQFQRETGIRQNWQWQCGAMALFLSWMDLLLYIQKIPYLGIYVVMFNDILKTFVKFSLVFLLFILSFAFTFHALLQNKIQFEKPFDSILKTTVMMVGEIDFGGTFFGDIGNYREAVNYELVTYLIFSIFIIVMMIIIMNLLVGLAVGDIMEVKENATLERLKMQVELALEVEFSVPNFLRKRFVRMRETIRPNRYRKSNPLKRALLQNQDLSSKNIINAMSQNKGDTVEIRENISQLHHTVKSVRNKANDVDVLTRDVINEIREIKAVLQLSTTSVGGGKGSDKRRAFHSQKSFDHGTAASNYAAKPYKDTVLPSVITAGSATPYTMGSERV